MSMLQAYHGTIRKGRIHITPPAELPEEGEVSPWVTEGGQQTAVPTPTGQQTASQLRQKVRGMVRFMSRLSPAELDGLAQSITQDTQRAEILADPEALRRQIDQVLAREEEHRRRSGRLLYCPGSGDQRRPARRGTQLRRAPASRGYVPHAFHC